MKDIPLINMRAVLTILLSTILTSCAVGINKQQEKAYAVYKENNLLVEEKNPSKAFKFGFLPGGASFYNSDYDLGFVNLITWPISIFWEVGNAKSRSMLINFEATEEIIKKKFKKEMANLDDRLRVGDISQKEYNLEFNKLYTTYYNPNSFLLAKYQPAMQSELFIDDGGDSSLLDIEKRIRNVCNTEYRIYRKEIKALDQTAFMHKCRVEKRKDFVKLGL